MSLLTPSAGEIVDRLTIIAMKQESGNGAEHLKVERLALEEMLIGRVLPNKAVAMEVANLGRGLAAVNAFIWHKEDEVRRIGATTISSEFGTHPCYDPRVVARLAIEVRALADRRHELIAEIDRLFGEPRAGKEKSWMKPLEEYHTRKPE